MNISQLKMFLAVVDQGSYNKAAEVLKIDRSAISRQLDNLAEELGHKFFVSPKPGPFGPELTAAGKVLYNHSHHIVEYATKMQEEIHAVALGHMGTLTLAIGASLNEEIIEKYIVPLDKQENNLIYELMECTVPEQEELLLLGKAELGISNTHIATPDAFEILHHVATPYYVFCLEDHPLAQLNRPLKLKDLEKVPLGLTYNSAPKFITAMRNLGLIIYPKIRSKIRFGSINAAKKGLCVAVFPASGGFHIDGLKAILLDEPSLQGETTLYKPKGKALSPAAEAFIKLYIATSS